MTLCWGRTHEKKLCLVFRSLYYLNHEYSIPQTLEIKNRAQFMRYGGVMGHRRWGLIEGRYLRALGREQQRGNHMKSLVLTHFT